MTDETSEESGLKGIYDKLESVDNKLERIKSDTHNLNRIASLSNTALIIQELKKLVGNSTVKAAILHLTKEEISAGDLAKAVGIASGNLSRDISPFLGNKGYIVMMKKGTMRYYQRSELLDLIGFESVEPFASLIKQWQTEKEQKPSAVIETAVADANAT